MATQASAHTHEIKILKLHLDTSNLILFLLLLLFFLFNMVKATKLIL